MSYATTTSNPSSSTPAQVIQMPASPAAGNVQTPQKTVRYIEFLQE